jgi:hypothetical protein
MNMVNFIKSVYFNLIGVFEDPLGYLVTNLFSIHKGEFVAKLEALLSLALASSPLLWFYEKMTEWSMSNNDYVGFVIGAIIVDHVLGTIVHALIKKDFTFKKNVIGLIVKMGMAVAMGFLFEGINHIIKAYSFIKD